MGMTSLKSSASPSTGTSKSEAERFYSCCGTLKQPAKMIIASSILRTLLYLCSPLIHIVRIKKINFSDSEGEGEYVIFNAKHKDLRGR